MGKFTIIERIILWLRQLLCKHDFTTREDMLIGWVICEKCGKVKKII